MSDLIDRQAALDAVFYNAEHPDEAYQAIRELPSAQPERKKGFWIPQDFNKTNGMITTAVYYLPKCSLCGWTSFDTNFCPNCGADMRGEHDG